MNDEQLALFCGIQLLLNTVRPVDAFLEFLELFQSCFQERIHAVHCLLLLLDRGLVLGQEHLFEHGVLLAGEGDGFDQVDDKRYRIRLGIAFITAGVKTLLVLRDDA